MALKCAGKLPKRHEKYAQKSMDYGVSQSYGILLWDGLGGQPKCMGICRLWVMAAMGQLRL
jgi:hypothetical protein